MRITCSTLTRQHLDSLKKNKTAYEEVATVIRSLERFDFIVLPRRRYINTAHFRIHLESEQSSSGDRTLNIKMIVQMRTFPIEKVVANERPVLLQNLARVKSLSLRAVYRRRVISSDRKENGSTVSVRVREFSYEEHAILSASVLASMK